MTPRSDEPPLPPLPVESVVGFGLGSMRKSYYPELRRRLGELERFRTLFDSGNDLILLAALPDASPGAPPGATPGATIIDANLPACRRLGWERDELLGKPLCTVLHGHDLDRLLAGETDGQPAQVEAGLCCRDGDVFPAELTCRVTPDGAVRSALVVARDVTDRRRFECELRTARDRAERANMAKTKFLAAASHDLRQPAQSLSLFADLLTTQLAGHPAAQLVEHLHGSVDALRLLLDGILDMSRLDAGLVDAAPRAITLGPLLAQLQAEYEVRAREVGLRLRVVPCRQPVVSDPVLLDRILRNLVENAIRYTQSGGIVVGCRRHGRLVDIEVWDSGIGMDPDQLNNIFEEFYQAGNPERDRAQGLGLGLAIVQRLTHLLGHRIDVKSSPGRGSRFSVSVPVAD